MQQLIRISQPVHLHYYTLKSLAGAMDSICRGWTIVEVFSQEKDELVFGLAGEYEQLYIRVGCASRFQYIWPSREFSKRKKNVMELFPGLQGAIVRKIECLEFERVLVMETTGGNQIFFKMHGSKSNVIIQRPGHETEIFRKSLSGDISYLPENGKTESDESQFPQNPPSSEVPALLKAIHPVFSGKFALEVVSRMQSGSNLSEALESVRIECESGKFFIVREEDSIWLAGYCPAGKRWTEAGDVMIAIDFFIRTNYRLLSYTARYKKILEIAVVPVDEALGKLKSYRRSSEQIQQERNAGEIGLLIMSNLHLLEAGMTEIEVEDYYRGGKLKIKLDPKLSPVRNAERFFEKEKKNKARLRHIEEWMIGIESEINSLKLRAEEFYRLKKPGDLEITSAGLDRKASGALDKFILKFSLTLDSETTQQEKSKPYLEFEKKDYMILVGKNAKANDDLTFRIAAKEDTWLHARSVSGSHVIIRRSGNKVIPREILEYAAALAARYSKSKHESLVPVIYVPRKNVRKRKGSPPGEVIVEREQVILVKPAPIT